MDIRMSNIASPMPQVRAKFTNKLGIPLSGCKVYTYEPNSDIPKTTWLNIDKTTENTNPILLDAAGEADIFLDGLYRVVVKDRFGFVVYDVEKTGTHTEWDASFVVDASGETQQQVNYNGGAKWHSRVGGYQFNERVVLTNGDIVKSTIDGNANDPNVDMTGWVKTNDASQININEHEGLGDFVLGIPTYKTLGYSRQALGYNPTIDASIYDLQETLNDTNDHLVNGGVHLSKKFRGVRRNATALSVRGGRKDFNAQVVAVNNSRGFGNYPSNDGVGLYADATLTALESWEDVGEVIGYTSNTVTLNTATHADLIENIKIGDVIQTKHTTKCWGIVTDVNESTGVLTVDEWAVSSTTVVTPTGTTGFFVNFINKVWATNFNAIVSSDAAANSLGGVISEMGLLLQKDCTIKNGVDVVLLPGSVADGDTAFLARAAAGVGRGWATGFMSQGNKVNFVSTVGNTTGHAGILEKSANVVGIKIRNRNTYSMLWSTSSNDTDISYANSPAMISPEGRIMRQPKRVRIMDANGGITENYLFHLVTATGVSLVAPPAANHISGHYYEFLLMTAGTYTFTANADGVLINGNPTATITTTEAKVKYTMLYDGSSWLLYKG